MEKRGLSSFSLKVFGLCFMVLGSIPLVLGTELFPYYRIFFRIAAVLFAFVLTEGFFHTSSRTKYLVRLLIAGVIMYGGNRLIAYLTGNNLPLEYGMFLTCLLYTSQLFEETVEKDVAFGPGNLGLEEDEIRRRVKEAIELVGLDYDCLLYTSRCV